MNRRSFLGFLGLSPAATIAGPTVQETDNIDFNNLPPSDPDPWSGIPKLVLKEGNTEILICQRVSIRTVHRIYCGIYVARRYFAPNDFTRNSWRYWDPWCTFYCEMLLISEKYGKVVWKFDERCREQLALRDNYKPRQ